MKTKAFTCVHDIPEFLDDENWHQLLKKNLISKTKYKNITKIRIALDW
jgi:TusA-related sulfurtransferase